MARRRQKSEIPRLIFDTDLLIGYLRGIPHARELLVSAEREDRSISSLTLMELMQGCRDREEMLNVQALVAENIPHILHPKTSVSEKAIHLIDSFSLSHGLRVIDALIASTALLNKARLVTGHAKHFRFIPGIEIIRFVH